MQHGNKLVCGVGVNDANYFTQRFESWYVDGKRKRKLVWSCPYYNRWKGVIRRCYSGNALKTRATYVGCTVAKEWLTFSNFREWMVSQENVLGCLRKLHLDKDFIVLGNKVYSADTCVFVHSTVNVFITDSRKARGKYLLGVCKIEGYKFSSVCSDPMKIKPPHVGYFNEEESAHVAWRERKHEYAIALANSNMVSDERVRQRLLTMYSEECYVREQ